MIKIVLKFYYKEQKNFDWNKSEDEGNLWYWVKFHKKKMQVLLSLFPI